MPEIIIYSDPHIGMFRKAHSTLESSIRRELWARAELGSLLDQSPLSFCLGDFFDRESNSEEVILAGIELARKTKLILAGNHDIPNRESKLSSLELLREVLPDVPLIADKQENDGFITDVGNTSFFFAPHALSQAGYDAMIEGLRQEAESCNKWRVLCLHCNYGLSASLATETTLNLTEERAEELLGTFHTILVGHVHTPNEYFGGRLKIVGSVFPTAFDNLDDKFALLYDTETGKFERICTWSALEHLLRCPASLIGAPAHHRSEGPERIPIQYYDLDDDLGPGQAQALAIQLFKAGAFGVRINLREREEAKADVGFTPLQFQRLPDSIEHEIRADKPHLYALWTELRSQAS